MKQWTSRSKIFLTATSGFNILLSQLNSNSLKQIFNYSVGHCATEKHIFLAELVRKMRLSPLLMENIENQLRIFSALGILAALLTYTVSVFAGGISLDLLSSALSTITQLLLEE